mgnify:FL=1
MVKTVLEALEELKIEAQNINRSHNLTDWKNKAVNLIIRVYGQNSRPEKQIIDLKYNSYMGGGDNISTRKEQAKNLIDGIIKEINRFGLPEKMTDENSQMSINITQSQNQRTKISLNLLIESIQDELTGKQLKEVQEIIESKDFKHPEKKKKIVEKLKEFGTNVASNILASILTNPNLYG